MPLGGIVVSRNLDAATASGVERCVRRSIEYAFANPGHSVDFIAENARETDASVTAEHIRLYVNNYSLSLGQEGRGAVERLLALARERKLTGSLPDRIFL